MATVEFTGGVRFLIRDLVVVSCRTDCEAAELMDVLPDDLGSDAVCRATWRDSSGRSVESRRVSASVVERVLVARGPLSRTQREWLIRYGSPATVARLHGQVTGWQAFSPTFAYLTVAIVIGVALAVLGPVIVTALGPMARVPVMLAGVMFLGSSLVASLVTAITTTQTSLIARRRAHAQN